jgi:hypothetical protein
VSLPAGNRQSAIGNRQSAIGNRQSAIGNENSKHARYKQKLELRTQNKEVEYASGKSKC